MTRRDWEEIAEAIASELREWEASRDTLPAHLVSGAIMALTAFAVKRANALAAKSQRFDRDRFLTAAGIKKP